MSHFPSFMLNGLSISSSVVNERAWPMSGFELCLGQYKSISTPGRCVDVISVLRDQRYGLLPVCDVRWSLHLALGLKIGHGRFLPV
jgi:hypothetical protein